MMKGTFPKGFAFTDAALQVVRSLVSGEFGVAYVCQTSHYDRETDAEIERWNVVGISAEWAPSEYVTKISGIPVLFPQNKEELIGRQMDYIEQEGFELI